jgi:hypothetical protein
MEETMDHPKGATAKEAGRMLRKAIKEMPFEELEALVQESAPALLDPDWIPSKYRPDILIPNPEKYRKNGEGKV